jgi:hypothetical protein
MAKTNLAVNTDSRIAARVAVTGALPANTRVGNRLTANANSALPLQDGVALVIGDRLLVWQEAAGENNGVYVIADLGSAGTPWIMDRSPDLDTSGKMLPDTNLFVQAGATQADHEFVLSTNAPITLNVTPLTFFDFGVSIGGTVSLQAAYDGSGGPPAPIVLTAAQGTIRVRDAAATVGDLLLFQNNAGTRTYLRVIGDTGGIQVNLGTLETFSGTDNPIAQIDGVGGTFKLWPGTNTFTSSPGNLIRFDGTTIHDYPSASFGGLQLQGIVEHKQAGGVLNHFLLFNNGNTYRNTAGLAVNFGPGQAFIDQPVIEVNGAVALTMSQLRSFLSQPAFRRTTAGLGTLVVTTVAQLQLFGAVETGVTITTWNRIQLGAFTTFTGTITTYNGIRFENVTGPTTSRAMYSTVTTGDFIRHEGTAACFFGGVINLGSGATFDVALSRGAANRLDLASGDTFRIVSGSLEFAGTAETISRTAGELLLTATQIRTSAELEIDGALDHDGTTAGFYGKVPVVQGVDWGSLTDNVAGTVNNTLDAVPDPADTPVTADALRDDLVANTLPQIRDAISTLAARLNDVRLRLSAAAGGNGLIA